MRPIDYAIKLIAAHSMNYNFFEDMVESLYYEEYSFIHAVADCLKQHDVDVDNAVQAIFHNLDECQL